MYVEAVTVNDVDDAVGAGVGVGETGVAVATGAGTGVDVGATGNGDVACVGPGEGDITGAALGAGAESPGDGATGDVPGPAGFAVALGADAFEGGWAPRLAPPPLQPAITKIPTSAASDMPA